MRRFILTILSVLLMSQVCYATESAPLFKLNIFHNDTREIKSLLNSQVRYANRTNFNKFISTYDQNYVNSDGMNLASYSALVKDIWNSYGKIEYGIRIKDISLKEDTAIVALLETSCAEIPVPSEMKGTLRSNSDSIYYLKKINGKWKVTSDSVITETTSMLYGEAKNLDIKLTAPHEINANTEYTASLEFIPPEDTIVVASIANDKIVYPQNQTEEVFRKFPDDNILERLFTSNTDNLNEYVIASIGLTKPSLKHLSLKLQLTGFGYQITRVNVIPQHAEEKNVENQ